MNTGHDAPYYRVFYKSSDSKDIELTNFVKKFRYVYAEEEDDVCELELEFSDVAIADSSFLKANAELKVIWGYIGTNRKNERKVYVQDPKSTYGKTIIISLLCTEKAVSLKSDANQDIHENVTLPEIASAMADKHGLQALVQIPKSTNKSNKLSDFKLESSKITLFDVKSPETQAWLKQFKETESKRGNIFGVDNAAPVKNISNLRTSPTEFSLNYYDAIPQANRSSKQLLTQLGLKEKGGPTIIDTRDDQIIIRKRNFSQDPIKSFEYKKGDGEVLSFVPEFKSRLKNGSGTNLEVNGWNKMDKNFFLANANSVYDNLPDSLAKIQQMVDFLKKIPNQNEQFGGFYLDPQHGPTFGQLKYTTKPSKRSYIYWQNHSIGGKLATDSKASTTTVFRDLAIPVSVGDRVKVLEGLLNEAMSEFKAKNKGFYDPTSSDPNDTFNAGANARSNSNLDKHPATLEIMGEPIIEVGQVVTIVGVGKGDEGNYYVMKSEHLIDKAGYSTTLELVRDGNNFGLKDGVNVSTIGKTANNKIGPKHTYNTRRVKAIKNSRR